MPFDRQLSFLTDISENVDLALEFLGDIPQHEFAADRLRLYAVIRCLEIISEASRRLDPQLKLRHPEIDWRAIAAAGNIYRHEYEEVSPREIWSTVKLALPILRVAVQRELPSSP